VRLVIGLPQGGEIACAKISDDSSTLRKHSCSFCVKSWLLEGGEVALLSNSLYPLRRAFGKRLPEDR
jgi:hypothetical protein